MYSVMRTIIFSVSSFLIFLLYPLIQHLSYLLVSNSLGVFLTPTFITEISWAVVFILSLLIYAGLQSLIRFLLLYKYKKGANPIMTFPITAFSNGDKSIYYIVPFLVYLLPLFKRSYLNEIIIMRIGFTIIALLVFHGILLYSKSKTKAYFLKDGLLIRGLDVRLDFPLTAPLFNTSGYYPYSKFLHYIMKESTGEFILPGASDKIILSLSPGEREELKQFLLMIKIPIGNLHGSE